jgi:hypothetical protein
MRKRILMLSILLFTLSAIQWTAAGNNPAVYMEKSADASALSADTLHTWMMLLYQRVQAEGVNAPAAARIYGYAGVVAYESIVAAMPSNNALGGQLTNLPYFDLPSENAEYDWITAQAAAMNTVLPLLFNNASDETVDAFQDLYDTQIAARALDFDAATIRRSVAYGESTGEGLAAWIAQDYYSETRGLPFEPLEGEAWHWVITNPNLPAAEPYWSLIRPMAMDYPEICNQRNLMVFSTEPGSTFYKQAQEVMEVGDNLTPEQRDTALYWLDDPNRTGLPSGHWMMLTMQFLQQQGEEALMGRTVETYAMMGMVLMDSFISAWSMKYQEPLLRPETYINRYINPRWQPFIATPNFPEYPSGHSVVSAAAAYVLTELWGVRAFVDRTHIIFRHQDIQRAQREYLSFQMAADEAAMSRLYGGIHYRNAIEGGMLQGRCVAQQAFRRVTLNFVTQGE